jgi:hypothetical protein
MSALNPHRDVTRENAQWHFLSALCDADLPVSLRTEFCHKTQPHAFDDIACRTVFEEILAVTKFEKQQSQRSLRDDLPARVTRRGFPDLDFDLLFSRVKNSGNADAVETPEARVARAHEVLTAGAASKNRT